LARACIAATAVAILSATAAISADGQTATSLSSVKKLYLEPFGSEKQDDVMRRSLTAHLKKSGRYQIVDSASQADAILKGDGQIWVKGYFTINSRAPAANRQPVYTGFLSVEIIGKGGEPLWSYLVTPSKISWAKVADDLSGNLVDEMLLASKSAAVAGPAPAAKQNLVQEDLKGAGATFPAPLYRLWFQTFQREHPEIRLTYSEVGSESGIQMLADKAVDFAASDVFPEETSSAALHNVHFRHFATVLGGVVPVYHLDGLTKDLNFTPEMLADIYLGKITRWNDAEIKSSNKDANLPDAPIVVVHRSDGSGSTHAWSGFLSATNPEWKAKIGIGTKLQWPVGQGAEGNGGEAMAVEKTPNSIGYVEFVYAIQHQLSFGAVQNSSGRFIRASLNSLAEAASTAAGTTSTSSASIVNPPGKNAYPIASFTWLLIPDHDADPEKKQALLELVRWILTSGQHECSVLGYAPLPPEVASQQLSMVVASR
jgi:phosphate ABC transporter phosphate-binding protein